MQTRCPAFIELTLNRKKQEIRLNIYKLVRVLEDGLLFIHLHINCAPPPGTRIVAFTRDSDGRVRTKRDFSIIVWKAVSCGGGGGGPLTPFGTEVRDFLFHSTHQRLLILHRI